MESSTERIASFTDIYQTWTWGGESRSGSGSNKNLTQVLRNDLETFIREHSINSVLDVGCGEFNWQSELHLDDVKWIGIDIVPEIVEIVSQVYPEYQFFVHDLVETPFNQSVDLILVRDVIQHLDTEDCRRLIKNCLRTGCKYLLINHYPQFDKENRPLPRNSFGRYRPLNLFIDPFFFPRGYRVLRDYDNKASTVWRIEDLQKLDWLSVPENPTVLIAILARNKAHVLPDYLDCIVNQRYPKDQIVIYIRTNNNSDTTGEILKDWVIQHSDEYRRIEFDDSDISGEKERLTPHEWNGQRFRLLGALRERSLEKTFEYDCDYYFVVDCDNFIIPDALPHLVELSYPIVAPLLRPIPKPGDLYANFFAACNQWGFYQDHPLYYQVRDRTVVGSSNVSVVHCTYLIDRRVLKLLYYLDGSDKFEFIVFSQRARLAGVQQYINNELDFGTLLHPDDTVSLEEEDRLFQEFKSSKGLFGHP